MTVTTLPAVDLDALAARPLPPCEVRLEDRFCGKPGHRIARARCRACRLAVQFPICEPHAAMLRAADARFGGMTCTHCDEPFGITFGGLS